MGVSEEFWLPKLRDIVRRQESEREQRLAVIDKLSAFLGDAAAEVDKLSADPALDAESANVDLPAFQRNALEESYKRLDEKDFKTISEDLRRLEADAVAELYDRASEIYRGTPAKEGSGLVSRLQHRAHVLGDVVPPSAFTHAIVLNAARKLKSRLGVSSSTAQSLLKLALQSVQASLLNL